jgi:hypothetical protein
MVTPPRVRSLEQGRLSEALANQEFVDLDFGVLGGKQLSRLNEIREGLGQEILQDDRLVIPAAVVRKLYENRILRDGMSPDDVADVVYSVFRSAKAQPAFSAKHPHIQALINAREELSNIGFIAPNPQTGQAVIKTAFPVNTKRLPRTLK